jgi:hypothetical protein
MTPELKKTLGVLACVLIIAVIIKVSVFLSALGWHC